MYDFQKVNKKKILVVGDIMIDTYYTGDVSRISPEAPVPVFRKDNERSVLGGAANVAANLIAARQDVTMMSIVGMDENGVKLLSLLQESGISTELIIESERKTTEKIRFLAINNQQVLRLDIEDCIQISEKECKLLLSKLEDNLKSFDLILISDYLKGLLTYELTQGIILLAKKNKIPVIIDVKDRNIEKYKGATLIKPNRKELGLLTGMPVATKEELIEASEVLRVKCDSDYILTTCGAKGMVLIGQDQPYFIESVGREVFDVSGAGDTTIAYLSTCMVNGFSVFQSVEIANYAAGIQVSKVGTSSVYWKEIEDYLANEKDLFSHKLLIGNKIQNFRKEHEKEKIVFTNGCFDILHVGHVRYLQEAAKLGDKLVVGLNSDDSVRRLKGEERPVNKQLDRAEVLCSLGFVDYVVIFEEDTPYELIKEIQPDVLVKGGDYTADEVVGKDIVENRGGQLVLIPFVEGKSTSKIIEKIKQ